MRDGIKNIDFYDKKENYLLSQVDKNDIESEKLALEIGEIINKNFMQRKGNFDITVKDDFHPFDSTVLEELIK